MQDFLYLCSMKKRKKSQKQVQPKEQTVIVSDSWYGKFRQWVLSVEERQKNDMPPIVTRDTATYVCPHCGTEYSGAYCPKCSMPSRWKRFNWKLLFLNFLDIWGLGNRPMFRTIRDLFWRPGYMIRDYLRGHHLSYFPPFKMLAVWTLILMFMMWLLGNNAVDANDAKSFSDGYLASQFDNKMSAITTMLITQIDRILAYLDDHMLYSIIAQNILVVLAVKSAFRKVSDFNLVETFFSQIYINCQFHILAFVSMLLTWHVPEHYSMYPYMVGLIPAPLVLTYDFHQLYDITWKRALWKFIVTTINLMILYFIVILVIIAILYLVERFSNPNSPLLMN